MRTIPSAHFSITSITLFFLSKTQNKAFSISLSLSLSLFFIFDGESCGSVGVYSVPHGGGWLRRSREFIFEAHTPILRRGQGAVAIEEFEFECERGREMVAEEE